MIKQPHLQSSRQPAPRPQWRLRIVLALIGFTAVIAQISLMRELVVVFYGNELALGAILVNWLLWTAIGSSLLGRWAGKLVHPQKLVAALQTLVALALPLTLMAVRTSRVLSHSLPGEILGPGPMLLTSTLTLSVFCVLSGGLFVAGSRWFEVVTGAATGSATGSVYLLEAAGSAIGGIIAGLILARLENPFWIVALLGILNILAAWTVAGPVAARRRTLAAGLGALAVLVIVINYVLQPLSLPWVWRGFHVTAVRNSVYGNLAVVETGASRSLFENGLIMMTVPDPAAAEEAVHYALLEHPSPQRVLLIGGGVNGSVAQALTHPGLQRLDYVELDPMIFDLAAQYFPDAWDLVQHDPRVRVHSMDGRRFLKLNRDTFDVIIVNLPGPHTAQLNRFYTEEFFREAASRLRPGGMVSFQVASSENYISRELADYLACLQRTLRQVFPEVVAIPGETVHFFAAERRGTLTSDPQELVRRLKERRLPTQYVREYLLPFRMSPDRMQDFEAQIQPLPSTPVNRDFAPVAYYFDSVLWSARFQRNPAPWMESLAGIGFRRLSLAVTLFLAALVPLLWMWPARRGSQQAARARRSVALAVAAAGFTQLGLEILLLLGFQALYGYVYHELTILLALFMGGLALGAWCALRSPAIRTGTHNLRQLAALQIVLAASPLLLYALFVQLGRMSTAGGQYAASEILFPGLALLAGLLGGFQFLLAGRVYFAEPASAVRSPGLLYALDLAGSCAGALALSILLIPLYGFLHTAVLMAAVNLAPAGMAAFCGRNRRTSCP